MEIVKIKISDCFEEMGVSIAEISKSANLISDIGLDSLDVIELLFRIEYSFNITIPDNDWYSLETIEKIEEYLAYKLRFGSN
jgi:acyl carrier protein